MMPYLENQLEFVLLTALPAPSVTASPPRSHMIQHFVVAIVVNKLREIKPTRLC